MTILDIEAQRTVHVGKLALDGVLSVPAQAGGLVLFAHGSGSSRLSPRNRHVAAQLADAGFGTLLFDLLTEAQARDRANVFDIPLLADHLVQAADWVVEQPEVKGLPIAYFGASTGAAAALVAATQPAPPVAAVVSRGGRPDLAGDALKQVRVPTLLIVGGEDRDVLQLNRQALALIPAEKQLAVVPGATHLFEEPGALDRVVDMTIAWLQHHLVRHVGVP